MEKEDNISFKKKSCINFKYLGLGICTFLLCVGAGTQFFRFKKWDWLKQQSIEIIWQTELNQNMFNNNIQFDLSQKMKDLSGQWIWRVSLEQIKSLLEDEKRIKDFSIKRIFPNKIRLNLVSKKIHLVFLNSQGKLFPVGEDGTLFPESITLSSLDFPLVRGSKFQNDLKTRQQAVELISSLSEEGVFSKKSISEIYFDSKTGLNLILNSSGIQVVLGEDRFGLKASRVERVLNYLYGQQLQGRVIDARFAKKVVVRLHNDP
ncbi:MAG: cell division protein FtsQ/DivIB [Bdellovibrionales bacterium]|nr:cell division protein FtsQ/DivIB [Bdellovibrionales bacterium]